MEVVIADAMSDDGTRRVIGAFQQEHPRLQLRVVDNTKRIIPAALNTAIRAAHGEIIVRLDAHSVPKPDYVALCVQDLEAGRGANVGGIWLIEPGAQTWIARSIAAAAAHPLGVGDAKYRYTDKAGPVDTVPFGAYYRSLVGKVGEFDEALLTNEDYEFNTRVRKQSGVLWLDPAIQATYYARPTLRQLAQQYWRYGYWKVAMLRRHAQTIRWRQALPPLFVFSLIGLGLLSLFVPIAGWILALAVVSYSVALFLVGAQVSLLKRDISYFLGVPLAISTMHLAWGCAFLWSIVKGNR
jgi:cellulose synthase/poly-beta-1,6-N-acetylglucosamine synthase-like glycosyltransferase